MAWSEKGLVLGGGQVAIFCSLRVGVGDLDFIQGVTLIWL